MEVSSVLFLPVLEGWMAGLEVYNIALTGTGHNRIATFAPVALAVTRAFESV